MITRIAGAYSTLAANPRNKRHSAARAKRRNPTREQTVAKLKEKLAEAERRLAQKLERASKKKGVRKPGYGAKAAARRLRKEQRATYGYALGAVPAGSTVEGYAYPVRRKTASGRMRLKGYAVGRKLAKGKARKPKFTLYRDTKGRLGMVRNAGPVVAGVPVVAMAIGSAASIGLGQVASALISKVPGADKLPAAIQPYLGDVAVAAAAAYLHGSKFLKNPMHKQIAQYAFIGSVFKIIDKATAAPIQNALSKIPALGVPAAAGIYFDPATAQTAGMYLSAEGQSGVGGMYVQAEGSDMGGLFSGQSIYG